MAQRHTPKHPGDILKRARLQAGMSEKILTKRIGISKEDLEAIENWQLDKLPDNAHFLPILKRVAKTLGVSFDKLADEFPRAMKRKGAVESTVQSSDPEKQNIVLTSLLKYGVAFIFVLALVGYIIWQSSSLGAKPPLIIFQPETNTVTSQESVQITGETGENIQVFINGTSAVVSEDGDFDSVAVLQIGTNTIEVRAVNNVGAENVQVLTLVRR